MRSIRPFLVLTLLVGAHPLATGAAQGSPPEHPPVPVGADEHPVVAPIPGRPRIALALSGGARGIAHIGVLQVLEELRVPVDIVTGTSMGAIVGGLYAAGMSPHEMEAIVNDVDWPAAFTDQPPRETRSFRRKQDGLSFLTSLRVGIKSGGLALPLGIVQGQELELVLRRLLMRVAEVRDFDDLRIPFRAAATDIVTGQEVILRDGDLVSALRASMSIPGAFEPVERDGRLLVDGMVMNNIPIAEAIAMGADVVIAVDVGTPLRSREQIDSSLAVADQVLSILTKGTTQLQLDQLRSQDLLVRPELDAFGNADFELGDEIVPVGEAAARAAGPRLATLSTSDEVYAAWVRHQRLGERAPPVIVAVDVRNDSRLGDDVAREAIQVPLDEPLDLTRLERGIRDLYGTEFFQSIKYEIVETEAGDVLFVRAREKPWGPRYLRVGLGIEENFDNTSFYQLGVNFTIMPTNAWGAEWRNEATIGNNLSFLTEWYQPIGDDLQWFVAPQFNAFRTRFPVYDGDDRIGEVANSGFAVGVDLGRELGSWGELRLGVRYLDGSSKPVVGLPELAGDDQLGGGYYLRFATDTLDSTAFPTRGQLTRAVFGVLRDHLGSTRDYEVASFEGFQAISYRENTVVFGLQATSTFGGSLDLTDLVRVGGFLRLSGLDRDQLAGRAAGVAKIIGYRRIATPGILSFRYPLYVGASVEYGGAWLESSDVSTSEAIFAGSVWLGLDSPIGPIYLAYGLAEGGQDSVYLFVGQIF